MRTFINLLLVAVLALSFGCAATAKRAAEPVRLTVMTYNIHHAEGMDGKLDLERIADVIRRCEADLVALQEVDQGTRRTHGVDQPAELARLTGMHVAYGPAMDYDGGKYGNAILSRYPILLTDTMPLPYRAGDRREPRAAVWAEFLSPAGVLGFASTHLDHTKEPSDRLAQATALKKLPGDGSRVILAGDFNCEPTSEPMVALTPIWTIVSNGDPAPTCPANKPRVKIDHVLVHPAFRWRVIEAKVIDEPVASDHRPVVVKLRLE